MDTLGISGEINSQWKAVDGRGGAEGAGGDREDGGDREVGKGNKFQNPKSKIP